MSNQHDFILLDRSGSMADKWHETLSSINAYVKQLAEENVETEVTLAVFDGRQGCDFEVIRNKVAPNQWEDLSKADASPRGWTPLNDAIGELVALANKDTYDKAVLVIMTDGAENASKNLTLTQAKQLLDGCRAKGWQIIFLGADYDNAAEAASYGNMAAGTAQVSSDMLVRAMKNTASLRASYGLTGQSMSFSNKMKAEFKGSNK